MITDFHAHVLPAVDDGSGDVSQSIEMLRMLSQQGVRRVVATPHFYPQHDRPENFLVRRAAAEHILREEMVKYTDMPLLSVGAEVYYFRGISDSAFLRDVAISGTRSVMIEMPSVKWTDSMYRDLEDIYHKQGLIPILAHIDRYIGTFSFDGIFEKLLGMPVYVQLNAEAFQSFSMRQRAIRMIRNGQVQLLGSDCHDTVKRPPNLDMAVSTIRKKLGLDAIEYIQSCEQEIFRI